MTFNPEFSWGNVLTSMVVIAGILIAWVRREKDVSSLGEKITGVNNSSEKRFNENATKLDNLATKVQNINEHGSPASTREMDLLRTIVKEHGDRLSVLEAVRTELAVLGERSKAQSQMMEEIKQQLKELLAK